MFAAIRNNIYPAMALVILPVGYFIGTELRERNDAKKMITQMKEQDPIAEAEQIEQLKQQLESLREEREMVLIRQDIFEEKQQAHRLRAPSITTICLLQIQAYVIQILANLPLIIDKRPTTATSSSSLTFLLVYQQKRLHIITSLRSIIRQCLRWILLVILLILDNVARVLNVEREMADITATKESTAAGATTANGTTTNDNARRQQEEEEQDDDDDDDEDDDYHIRSSTEDTYHDDYYLQKKSSFNNNRIRNSDQCTNTQKRSGGNNSSTNNIGCRSSEPTSPTTTNKSHSMVSPSSPINSPTPEFLIRPRPASTIVSPVLKPSHVNHHHHRTRSLSNNMIDQQKQQQKQLRRITGQREITLQNAVLPIPPRKSTHHHHHKKPPISTANSVASRSSSESSVGGNNRPRMQKTMSLSTAQQHYQHQSNNELSNNSHVKTMGELLYDNPLIRKDLMNGVVQPVQHHHHIHNNNNSMPWK